MLGSCDWLDKTALNFLLCSRHDVLVEPGQEAQPPRLDHEVESPRPGLYPEPKPKPDHKVFRSEVGTFR